MDQTPVIVPAEPELRHGKIYGLYNKLTDELFYVGSTFETLSVRMSRHKYNSNVHPNRNIYKHVNEIIGGWQNVECRQLKDIGLCDKRTKLREENDLIIEHAPMCNMKSAVRARNNTITCECGKTYNVKNKYRHDQSVKHVNYEMQLLAI